MQCAAVVRQSGGTLNSALTFRARNPAMSKSDVGASGGPTANQPLCLAANLDLLRPSAGAGTGQNIGSLRVFRTALQCGLTPLCVCARTSALSSSCRLYRQR